MALETGTYIDSLVATNPTGSDGKNQGDDHFRLLKSTSLNTWTEIAGAVTATHTELNILDGVTASTADINATTNFEETISATTSEVTIATAKTLNVTDNSGLKIAGTAVSSTAAELNILDGVTVSAAEINRVASLTEDILTHDHSADGDLIPQGGLQSSLQQTTASLSLNTGASITFTGGAYTLGWGLALDSTALADATVSPYDAGAYNWGIGVYNATGGTQSYYFQARYITASPPYNLGDGDVPLFVFALVDSLGNLTNIDVAPDPSWAYNGPTNIAAQRKDKASGRKFRKVFDLPPGLQNPLPGNADINARIARQRAMANFLKTPVHKEIELTNEYKNSDMGLIPHPFLGNDLTGKTVILLDPVSPVIEELLLLQESGESVNQMLHDGYFTIGSTELGRARPNGVMTVSVDWK